MWRFKRLEDRESGIKAQRVQKLRVCTTNVTAEYRLRVMGQSVAARSWKPENLKPPLPKPRDDGTPDPRSGGGGAIETDVILGEFDLRGGGRISFDAWVTRRLRLRAEYDLSSSLDWAPEIPPSCRLLTPDCCDRVTVLRVTCSPERAGVGSAGWGPAAR